MTMHATNAGGVRRRSPSIARIVRNWMVNASRKRRVRREKAELHRLPHHLQRDMGLEAYASPPELSLPLYWR